jgi:hypothetical protein
MLSSPLFFYKNTKTFETNTEGAFFFLNLLIHSLVSVTALSTRMIQNEKDAFFAQYAHDTDNAVLEIIWQAKIVSKK